MGRRLVKIAKELNVGTTTIVEHLLKSGFEIENKPTAKVTDEMYNHLLQEFQGSVAIKEQADQLVIGTRPQPKKETPPPPPPQKETPPVQEEPSPEPVVEEEVVQEEPAPEPVVEEPVAKEPEPEAEAEVVDNKPKLKILGKIDLDKKTSKKTKPEKKEEAPQVEEKAEEPSPEPAVEEPVAQEPETVEEVVEEKEVVAEAKEEEPAPEAETPEPVAEAKEEEPAPETTEEVVEETEKKSKNKMVRAETPELRGLKIQGKIDLDKFQKPKKKKKEKEKEKPKAKGTSASDKPTKDSDNKQKGQGSDDQNRRKRKRTRRRVSTTSQGGQHRGGNRRRDNRGGSRNQKDEVKEVSQKEIEEKIKATMARISGGGKKKRQKMRRDNRERLREKQEQIEQERQTDKLQLTEFVSVTELASLMDVPVTEVITTCMNLGVIVSINQRLDAEIIELLAEEFNHEVEFISVEEQADEEFEIEDDDEDLSPRAPIVTVMGHVDHGKTSLLDYIREANVADGEAGGITQHIGAYEVYVGDEKKRITFLDTPGHEAFTAMRARGAKVTDIAIIIIAADDNIMPQTKEAISHAQAAGVPMVFAINKIDKPGANPDKIKQELASMNLLIEEWGGSFQSQDISAKTGQNIDLLLEKILLEAEILELQANPDRKAIGTVLEASLDKGRGYVTKMLVQTGTLHIGDPIVASEFSGKIKAMFNERGKRIKQAGPSTPVLILGLSGAPQAGERFKEVDSEQEARQIASKRGQISREQTNRATKRISLDEIGRRLALGTFKELNLIVKGDVDGSIEALSDSLIKLSIETIQVNVIHKAVGQIIESDVLLASASDAIIIGFQVRPSLGARKLAEKEGVEIKTYSIIYEAIEEIKMAIEGMLEPTKEEKITAQVEVREVYKISRVGTIAGCYVQDGVISRNSFIRLVRNGIVVYPTKEGATAEIASLKRFKEDAKEVKNGLECGIAIKNFNDIKVGDIIEGYEIVEVKQKLK
jgi:translation initiation factor IF-2